MSKHNWQPIETAPKDGTLVWGFRPSEDACDEQSVFWWDKTRHGEYWTNAADDANGDPTHWLPLPAPPARTRSTEQEG